MPCPWPYCGACGCTGAAPRRQLARAFDLAHLRNPSPLIRWVMAGHHDLGYKYLFAHPELVRELLVDFTDFGWLGALEGSTWERVNPGYVSDRFSERCDDVVWRVGAGENWLYIYILLEFQSGVDRWMALRMQVYIGLLYQDLVKRKEFSPDALLPPVLPLVFYNGEAEWGAATDLGMMIMQGPDALLPFQARQRYALVDQRRLEPAVLAAKRSVLAMLFRLELSEVPEVLIDILPLLGAWLRHDAQAPLQRSVAAWVEQVLARQFDYPQGAAVLNREGGMDMSERKFANWAEYLEDKGMQKGMQLGMQQGRQFAADSIRNALTKVLEKRFGPISPAIAPTLAQASVDELGQWLDQALDAPSAEALLRGTSVS